MRTPKDPKNSTAVKRLNDKKKQAALTTKWLYENYCACSDVCLPRGIVYDHYLDFCRSENTAPACKATFGKLIRSTFPGVTSKRLGARGHSKYHYNGIGIKSSSGYYTTVPEPKGLTRFSKSKPRTEVCGSPKRFSLSTKVGTLLPKFPDVEEFVFEPSLDKEKLKIFLTMYKTHCQCIVDTATSGNLEEIRVFLLHFWQGFPEHLMGLIHLKNVIDLIVACDWILYKTLLDVLFPSTLCEIPESLLCDIQNLGKQWENWLLTSMENLPQKLLKAKMTTARFFKRTLKRYVAFLHLAQVIRPLLSDNIISICDEIEQLNFKWLDLDCCSYSKMSFGVSSCTVILKDFQNELRKVTTVENLTKWIDTIVKEKLFNENDGEAFISRASVFLLEWIYTFNRLSHFFTSTKSDHFILFHLLSTFLQEYLFLAVEDHLSKIEERKIYSNLRIHLKNYGNHASLKIFESPTSCFLVKHDQRESKKRKSETNSVFIDLQHEDLSEKFQRYRTFADNVCDGSIGNVPLWHRDSSMKNSSYNYNEFTEEHNSTELKQRHYNLGIPSAVGSCGSSLQVTQFPSTCHYAWNGNHQQMNYGGVCENPLLDHSFPIMEQPLSISPCNTTVQEHKLMILNHAGYEMSTNNSPACEHFFLPTETMSIL